MLAFGRHQSLNVLQDDVFPDDEMEEELNDVNVENEKNLANETTPSAPASVPSMMMKPVPAASVGEDGITTVSINNAAAAPASVANPHHEIKKGKLLQNFTHPVLSDLRKLAIHRFL